MAIRKGVGGSWICFGLAAFAFGLLGAGVASLRAEDWPTYAHDVARSNVTADKLQTPLHLWWTYQPQFKPDPAWADPKPVPVEGLLELRRVHFDDALQPVIAGGRLYFGSSSENKVCCLDASSGQLLWTRITGGPVRLAPTISDGRVYVGSDDGYAYCLDAASGAERWKFHAAPEDRRVLGHGRMISLWPLRTGILVDKGVAYFGAGIFPAEGVFLYALDALTGRLLWKNDSCGEAPQSRVSPQGYLLASETTLYAPMGRVSPGAFDRATGELQGMTAFGKTVGGTYALLAEDRVFTGTEELVGYSEKSAADRFAIFGGHKLIVAGPRAYVATGDRLMAFDRQTYPAAARKLQIIRNSREAADKSLTALRKEKGELTRDIANLEAELRGLENAGTGKDRLTAQREKLNTQLAAKRKRLEDWRSLVAKPTQAKAAAEEEFKQAQARLSEVLHWDVESDCDQSLVLAGDLVLAGGNGRVLGFDAATGKTAWSAKIQGQAKGLAVANGKLFVSSDQGPIHCFGAQPQPAQLVKPAVVENPFADAAQASLLRQAAQQVLQQSKIQRGFALVLGCRNGALALELARHSELMVYAVCEDETSLAAVRAAIDAAGLYGARVCAEYWPANALPYSDYFANLIVCESTLLGGPAPDAAETFRMLKPLGGVALLGFPQPEAAQQWLNRLPDESKDVTGESPAWARLLRGALPGAGSWTHQYGNPANTACGDDLVVKAPFSVLWFGEPGPAPMLSRHARAAGPVSIDGRFFSQGENCLMAYDAYNGLKLWERDIRGAIRPTVSHDGSNLALTHDALFVAVADTCLRLDPASGETRATYELPPDPDSPAPAQDYPNQAKRTGKTDAAKDAKAEAKHRWGYIAYDSGRLYGSRCPRGTESTGLFAIDVASGQRLWEFRAERIPHNSIAISAGQVFLVNSDVTREEVQAVLQAKRREVQALPQEQQSDALRALANPDIRAVVALDAATGQVRWRQVYDLTYCGGNQIACMAQDGVLLVFGVYLDGHYWKQFFAGDFAGRRVAALAADDGHVLWSQPVGYRVRPIIVGDTLYAEPWAFDLRTGKTKTRTNPISGREETWQFARPGHHCGCPNAAPHCLFFRSYCLGYYDLDRDLGTQHFGAQRPGCWINFIPTGGLLVVPEASTGCLCPFPNVCSIVFQPTDRMKGFSYYSAVGSSTPVQRLALNFGAPGDRKDAAGNLWLGYPRPGGSLVFPLKLDLLLSKGGRYFANSSTYTPVSGTDDPWLFASAVQGIVRCSVPLLNADDGTALYRVRLAFADPDHSQAGARVFDIQLQGRTVLSDCDIVRETGGPNRALWKEFDGIEVRDNLLLELVPKTDGELPQLPILQGLEIIQQRVLSMGCAVKDLSFNASEPRRSTEIHLSNMHPAPVRGDLLLKPPAGFKAEPQRIAVELQPGQRLDIPFTVSVSPSLRAGNYTMPVRLIRADGSLELERTVALEHLGRYGRVALPAIEDSYVSQRYMDQNKGAAGVLLVDGGAKRMGDESHSVAYLKFRLDLPGKPIRATLRLRNAGNRSVNGGQICLVTEPWDETKIHYSNRPAIGRSLGQVGKIESRELAEVALPAEVIPRQGEVSLAIDPLNNDGVDYVAREGSDPPQLIVEYQAR